MASEETNLERKKNLERRTRRFAVSVFRMLDALPKTVSSRVIAFQLGKSASSVGANYHEANRAESREDFVHKIGIVLKEASETGYWIEVLAELYGETDDIRALQAESSELIRLFQASNRSLRSHTNVKTNRRIEK